MFALHIWSFIIRTRRLRKIFGLQQSKLGLFWFRPWSVDRIPLSLDNWLSTHYSESWCIMFIVFIDKSPQHIKRLLYLPKIKRKQKEKCLLIQLWEQILTPRSWIKSVARNGNPCLEAKSKTTPRRRRRSSLHPPRAALVLIGSQPRRLLLMHT